MRDLKERHDIEIAFHDKKALEHKQESDRYDFYGGGIADQYMSMLMGAAGKIDGLDVLDFGCGEGTTTLFYAAHGAKSVEGFDISPESVKIAQQRAEKEGLSDRIRFRALAAEDIDYPDASFDVVFGRAILHHTDLEKTSSQLARVLKPGGKAYFLEPLDHNPFINLFRALTPWRRTPTEKPIALKELDPFRRKLSRVTYKGYHLVTLLAHGILFVTGSKKIFAAVLKPLEKFDRAFLDALPFFQRYCWTAVFVFEKGK